MHVNTYKLNQDEHATSPLLAQLGVYADLVGVHVVDDILDNLLDERLKERLANFLGERDLIDRIS